MKHELTSRIIFKTFKKGTLVHDADIICTRSYFIQKGLMRTYFLKEGKEVTEYFCSEGEWINSPRSLMQRTKDVYYIDALEETDAFCIHINDLGFLFDNFRRWSATPAFPWAVSSAT